MKKLILIIFILFPNLLVAQAVISRADSINLMNKLRDSLIKHEADFLPNIPPKSNTLVTDYTKTLSAKDAQLLENKLNAFNVLTTAQIAVVIMESIEPYDIMRYGRKLANSWGIGQKGKNNGILVLVALNDRKVSILTGRGIESVVTDSICTDIIRNDFAPHFKKGDFYGGLDEGTNHLIKCIKGENKAGN